MTRREAISGKTIGSKNLWMGQTHVAASTASASHHHGASETAIYIVAGNPSFVFLDADGDEPGRAAGRHRSRRLHLRAALRPAPRGEPRPR
jgi:hypothetical protein